MLEIPAPYQSLAVIGHDAAKTQIQDSYASGRLHHAWLITGPEGIGKATLAYHMAHHILSGGENTFGRFNPEHPTARLIMAQAHPDLFVLDRPHDEKTGRLKDSIPVEQARKLGPFLSMTASYGHGRVAILDEAHALNRNGQNAILKMIEEPPTGAIMILTATTAGFLLPTIRSRCRLLALDPLPATQMEIILSRLGVELAPDMPKQDLFDFAQGSIGRALSVIQSDVWPLFGEVQTLLQALPTLDLPRVHKLADRLSRKDESESYEVLTSLIEDTLRRAVRSVALGQSDPTGLSLKLAANGRLDKALDIWENVKKTFVTAQTANLDRKLALINVFSTLSRDLA
ncbi:MAG: DNA polymerase III subunit delta' [Bdellovibrionales bacterium]